MLELACVTRLVEAWPLHHLMLGEGTQDMGWELCDPRTGIFSATGEKTDGLCSTATLLSDGRVLVTKSYDAVTSHGAWAKLYEPKTGTFSSTGSMATAEGHSSATLLSDGRVLLIGRRSGASASAELFDPRTSTFSPTGSMNTARSLPAATLLPDGRVLVVGGHEDAPADAPTSELYDPVMATFSPTVSMSATFALTATLLADGRVLLIGCGDPAEVFCPATETFIPTGSMNVDRLCATAALLPDGQVLVTGGNDLYSGVVLSSAELYCPATGTFQLTGSMNAARTGPEVTVLPDGRALITGGNGPEGLSELYDPETATFRPTGWVRDKFEFTAVLLANGQVLMEVSAGGTSSAGSGPLPVIDDAFWRLLRDGELPMWTTFLGFSPATQDGWFPCARCGAVGEIIATGKRKYAVVSSIGMPPAAWEYINGEARTKHKVFFPADVQVRGGVDAATASTVLGLGVAMGLFDRARAGYVHADQICANCYDQLAEAIANPTALRRQNSDRDPIPAQMRFKVLQRDGFRCQYCGRSQRDGGVLHVDHVVPVAAGGETVESNLISACEQCNLGKSQQPVL